MKALSTLAFERKQDYLMKRAHLGKAGAWCSSSWHSLTMSPETSHLITLSLSFSRQKIEKVLRILALPACGG